MSMQTDPAAQPPTSPPAGSPPAGSPPAGIDDLVDDRLYLACEVAPLLRITERRLREIIRRTGLPATHLGLGNRRVVRLRGDIAKRLANGEIDLTGGSAGPPAHTTTEYRDPIRRRRGA